MKKICIFFSFLFSTNLVFSQDVPNWGIGINGKFSFFDFNLCAGDSALFEITYDTIKYPIKIDSIHWYFHNKLQESVDVSSQILTNYMKLRLFDSTTTKSSIYLTVKETNFCNYNIIDSNYIMAAQTFYKREGKSHTAHLFYVPFCVHYCPIEKADFTENNRVVCERTEGIDFTDLSNRIPTQRQWTFEGGTPNSSTLKNPTGIRYNQSGNYGVRLIASNPAGADTIYKPNWIKVLPSPTASDDTVQQILANIGDTLFLEKCFVGTKYLWKNSKQTVLDSLQSLQYIVRKNETLTCTVSQDSFCDANCIYKIKISDTPKIFIPNVISPNEDGNNDYLEIYGNQHQLLLLQIFDRWGNRIYSTTDPFGKWDGQVNNQKVNPGTYVWLIRYIDLRDNKEKVLNGDVTVVRE